MSRRQSARLSARTTDDPAALSAPSTSSASTSAASSRTQANTSTDSNQAVASSLGVRTAQGDDDDAPRKRRKKAATTTTAAASGSSAGGAAVASGSGSGLRVKGSSRSRRIEQANDDADSEQLDDAATDSAGAPLAAPPDAPPAADDAGSPPPLLPVVPKQPTPEPVDRLTPLSSELLALIFSFLVLPPSAPPNPSVHSSSPPSPYPTLDRPTLASLCLVSRSLLPHARAALYRDLQIQTRVQAHAVHRTLHGSETARGVRHVEANVEMMAKTSSQWLGWFLFHSMHSLCGIIGSCRHLLTLTLYLPADSSAWTQSLCQSFVDLKSLHTLTKDLEPSTPLSLLPSSRHSSNFATDLILGPGGDSSKRWTDHRGGGAGKSEGMDVGWRPRRSVSMWAVSQLIKPLSTLRALTTLRLCGLSSDSSTLPTPTTHGLRLTEVVLVEVNITNTDLLLLLGDAKHLERFTLWRSSLLSKRGLAHVLKRCPRLVELRVGGSWFGAKEEDDKNFPLDDALPLLPHLKHLFISGSLISPLSLELPSLALTHLFVTNSPSWTPAAVHAGLVKMPLGPGGEPGVRRLTLPEMKEPKAAAPVDGAGAPPGGGGGGRRGRGAAAAPAPAPAAAPALPSAPGSGQHWNATWRFTVRKTGEAKGVRVEDRWSVRREMREREGAKGGAGAEGEGEEE
ncbi:hypothetical protein JCM8097_009119, partial [Rhodosporidiobolus ruineniae]